MRTIKTNDIDNREFVGLKIFGAVAILESDEPALAAEYVKKRVD